MMNLIQHRFFRATIVLVLFFFAVTVADDYGEKEFMERLIDQAEELISFADRMIKEYNNHSKDHLMHTIHHERDMVAMLLKDLKHEDINKDLNSLQRLARLHRIEEKLLYHEHRIDEELTVLEELIEHHRHRNKTITEMLKEAEALIKRAEDDIKHHRIRHRNLEAVKHELHLLEQLVHRLKRHEDPDNNTSFVDEEVLARLERSLERLLERSEIKTPPPTTTMKPTSTMAPTTTTVEPTTKSDFNTHPVERF